MIIPVFLSGKSSYASVEKAEKTTLTDNIIGSAFKSLAKAFIATADIEKIKKNNAEKLKKMDEARFRKRYEKVYNIIKDCASLTEAYGLDKDLTKQQAIEKINSLDKKGACKIVDSVPNSLIANQFKLYLNEKKQEIEKSNLSLQIQRLWKKITSGALRK